MVNMFAYLNSQTKRPININTGYNNRHNDIVFGEELSTYIPYDGEVHSSVMERDQMAGVKELASKITREVYGEPRLVQFIGGVYNDLVIARARRGYKGVRGKNRKGLVCAILYIMIYYEDKARITIDKLVRAANKIDDKTKTRITNKMVNQYIKFVIENITFYRNQNHDDNSNNNSKETTRRYIYEDTRRLAILLQYRAPAIASMRRTIYALPDNIIENHIPRTVAAGIVYWYATHVTFPPNMSTNENILRAMSMSRISMKKITNKFKNVSIKI
jgi:hypothetical protein